MTSSSSNTHTTGVVAASRDILPPIRSLFPMAHVQAGDAQQLSPAALPHMMLPPRHVADELLRMYWEWDYPLMPLVHKTLFKKR